MRIYLPKAKEVLEVLVLQYIHFSQLIKHYSIQTRIIVGFWIEMVRPYGGCQILQYSTLQKHEIDRQAELATLISLPKMK